MLSKVLVSIVFVFLVYSSANAAISSPENNACESWGYHLILDCKGGDLAAVSDPKIIEAFVIELVDQIDMKRFGDAIIIHFGSEDVTGYSLLQLIETSSITGHFVDQNGDAYLDIFSCKPFSQETVIQIVHKYFNPKKIKRFYLTRQA